MDTIDEHIAVNEALYRDVNDNIRQATSAGGHNDAHFVCECGSRDCEERIAISVDAYKAIRQNDLHFFVKPGHETPRTEDVVERHPGYVIVQKPEEARPALEGTDDA